MQCLEANIALCFLAHAGPHIGVEHIGALSSLEKVLLHGDGAAGMGCILLCLSQNLRVRLIALGASAHHVHANLSAGIHQGVSHVIAVAYINQLTTLQYLHLFLDGEHIGQSLAGM